MNRGTIAVIGSGFAGSLLARILAVQGHRVLLLERGTHPRFAIGESTTPLANLSLERLARRYGLEDCYHLSAHGRWLAKYPGLRRGLKRGFTFYRHHAGERFADRGYDSERLLVAASPDEAVADVHWLRADVDHHFVREAIRAGVEYLDRVELTRAERDTHGFRLSGRRKGSPFRVRVAFVVDASGPGGFLARQLAIPSGLSRTSTRAALVYSHFEDARLMSVLLPDLPRGPYPDDWAAVHHVVDGGWMYSLRFDHGVTSAGFALSPLGVERAGLGANPDPVALWTLLLRRYPTIGDAFSGARPLMPIAYRPMIQHRLTRAHGRRWVMLPHAYAFVDPLFSTGIAWSLRAIERLALAFESAAPDGAPRASDIRRYASLVAAEADQIDQVVAGAYEAMAHFELFAAQAMIYFAAVSYAEAKQRLVLRDSAAAAWSGFLGVGDAVLEPIPRESRRRLAAIVGDAARDGSAEDREAFRNWVATAIAPRNVAGLADPSRHDMYPLDLDTLTERHALLGLSRDELLSLKTALRGYSVAGRDAGAGASPT